jgi:UDP-N-acetylglucosamine 1-carboxyvinyltransferase
VEKIVIEGGRKLDGHVPVGGAKNAALPIMTATLLAPGVHKINNVPRLRDVRTMGKLLQILGARMEIDGHTVTIDTSGVKSTEAPYELVKTMRASVYVLGPLLARYGRARVSLPGGCAWGPRPVNLHIKGMEELGADVKLDHGYIVAEAEKLTGAEIAFDVTSVGATGNVMMAAVLASGRTVIENAACEPDIEDLAGFLSAMGARIEGAGTRRITIEGVRSLRAVEYDIIPDRIEAATFMVAGALLGGEVKVTACRPQHCTAVISKLEDAGATIEVGDDQVTVRGVDRPSPIKVSTAPYPGFPTDVQAQIIALAAVSSGTSTVTDTIYLDRFTHVPELARLGADIELDGNVAIVRGVESLSGAPVMATDIRASAALILAGLKATGRTDVSRIYHIDRGYEAIEKKLTALGAKVWREDE